MLFKEEEGKTYIAKVYDEAEEKYLTVETGLTKKNKVMEYALRVDEKFNYNWDNEIEEETTKHKSGNDKVLYTAHTEYLRNIEINIENSIGKQAKTTKKSTLFSVLFLWRTYRSK